MKTISQKKLKICLIELLDMIDCIPCTCIEAYSKRSLIAPDCPRCNWIDYDTVQKIKNILND